MARAMALAALNGVGAMTKAPSEMTAAELAREISKDAPSGLRLPNWSGDARATC